MSNELLAVVGRLHPLVLHLPIGLIVGLAALEFIGVLRRSPPPLAVVATLTALTQLSAAVAIATGLLLEQEGGHPEALADQHRNGALVFLFVCIVLGRLARREERRTQFRVVLALALVAIGVTGHLGGSLTHGRNFLFEPLERGRTRSAPSSTPLVEPPPAESPSQSPSESGLETVAARSTFDEHIAPIFAASCTSCHGEQKRKGRFELHTREGLVRGGSSGPAFVAGDPANSALVERLKLPLDDEEHMPPADKPQLNAADIARIEAWIAAGAPFEGRVDAVLAVVGAPSALQPAEARVPSAAQPQPEPATPPAEALDALRARLVHVQPVSQSDPLLWIDFAAPAADIDDDRARELLAPLVEHVAELSLARTRCGDATLELLSSAKKLRKLDLRATNVSDAGLASLRGAHELRELNVSQTAVSDSSIEILSALPELERLVTWRSAITADGLARLRTAKPALVLEDGNAPASAALEAEGEVKFTSDAPLPGAAAVATALTPINAICPVSGSPVNPKYAVVFESKIVGFCCPNCPKEFWADPQAFAEKLK